VTGHKKKLVALLIAVALASGSFVAVSSASGGLLPAFAGTSLPARRTAGLPLQKEGSVQSATEGSTEKSEFDLPRKTEFPATGRELFFKMMLSVLLVIVLGAAAIYISRKLLPRIINSPGKQIRILETAYLGSKKAVHVIEIGNQKLLIGSTNENITMLADLTGSQMDNHVGI